MKWADLSDDDDNATPASTSSSTPSTPSSVDPSKSSDLPAVSLQHTWVLWFDDGTTSTKGRAHANDYEGSLKQLGTFNTIQDFWRYWNNVVDVPKMVDYSNLRMFKKGIKPMWEDPANMDGGKWVVQCSNKENTSSYTTKIALSIIGEQLEYGEDICGLVLSIRPKLDTINIWNRTCNNPQLVSATTNQLSEAIENFPLKYQAHKDSMAYKSPKVLASPRGGNSDDSHNDAQHNRPRIPTLALDIDANVKSSKSPRTNYSQSPLSRSGGYRDPSSDPYRSPHHGSGNGYNKDRDSHRGDRDGRDSHRDNRDRDGRDSHRDNRDHRDGNRDSHRDHRDNHRDNYRGDSRDGRDNNRDTRGDGRGDGSNRDNRRHSQHIEHHKDNNHNNNHNNHNNHNSQNNHNHQAKDHKDKTTRSSSISSEASTSSTNLVDLFAELQEMHKLNQSWADAAEDEEELIVVSKEKEKEPEPEKNTRDYRDRDNNRDNSRRDSIRDGNRDRDRENNRDRDSNKDKEGNRDRDNSRRDSIKDGNRDSNRDRDRDQNHRDRDKDNEKDSKDKERHEPVNAWTRPLPGTLRPSQSTPQKSPLAASTASLSQPSTPQLSAASHPSSSTHTSSTSATSQSTPPPAELDPKSQPEQTPEPQQTTPPVTSSSTSTSASVPTTASTSTSTSTSISTSVPAPSPSPIPMASTSADALTSSAPAQHSAVSSKTTRLRQEHKHHRKSRSVSVVEGQSDAILHSLLSQPEGNNSDGQSPLRTTTRRSSFSLSDNPVFQIPPLPQLPTQHLLSIIEPPLPSIPEFTPSAGIPEVLTHHRRSHKKSASVSQIGSVQSILGSPSPAPSNIKIGFSHRSPSQELLIPVPRKKSPSYANFKEVNPTAAPPSFSPPSVVPAIPTVSTTTTTRRRSSLPPPLQGVPPALAGVSPKRHTGSGRVTPVTEAAYASPPGSGSRSLGKSSEGRAAHKRSGSISDGKRSIDRPYYGGDGADTDELDEVDDVAFRADLSGASPIAPENFIRPIPLARRGSRSEKPIPAFFEPEVHPSSPVVSARTLERIPEVPTTPTSSSSSGKRRKKSRGSISGASGSHAHVLSRTNSAKKWSISEFIGVFVLAIFVAAITVTLQHSW